MQFSIKPVDLYHYDIFKISPIQTKLFRKSQKETYMGSVTINLNGDRVDLYCEDTKLKDYSEMIGEQAFAYYEAHL